ncbi:unnamed protein product [Trichobilharzia szidati]|nr:unnamed protein product [Trichobilharzia szidati]
MSVLSDTLHTTNGSEEAMAEDVCPRRLSRVSRLRDMFQNGIVRPIDDPEDGYGVESSAFPSYARSEPERFSRAFPGSPPMRTLRHHRSSLTKDESTQQSISSSRSLDTALSSSEPHSLLQSPPKRPPKPRHLSLTKPSTPEAVKLRPVASKMSSANNSHIETSELVKNHNYSITFTSHNTDNQSSTVKANGDIPHLHTAQNPTVTISHITSMKVKPHPVSKDPVEHLSHASITPLYLCNKIEKSAENCLNTKDGNCQSAETNESPKDSYPQSTQPTCFSLPDSSTDHHLGNSSEIQDFVLPLDAFHMSPLRETECKDSSDNLPVLQHAESVAVGTPDDEDGVDDKSDNYAEHCNTANSPVMIINGSQCTSPFSSVATLPIPKGLNVVAVDADGVHIFEDGNFLYALPGLAEKYSDDSDFYDSREDVGNVTDLNPAYSANDQDKEEQRKNANFEKLVSTPLSSTSSKVQATDKLVSKRSGSSDSLVKQPRVRFSSEPILVFSTHSTTDYNRRNEEIDPLSASAEYELEKHLEDMEMFEIDFHKGANGLGISIVGSGVDTSSGEQKLSIFIKSLTTGGAAEADGRIQVYDQIVQVDGHSLVGVSQQFAAQVLQSTGDIIHFVLAREKDPPNSRIAKILTEKHEEEEESRLNKSPDKSQEVVSTQTDDVTKLSGGDSTEALHNLIAVATRTLKQANVWDDDDDDNDDDEDDDVIAATGENGDDFDLESPCIGKYMLSNDMNEVSPANSIFEQYRKSNNSDSSFKILNGSPAVSDHHHSSPRSALKGTATAASTRRRNEAIMDYIRQAVEVRDNVCLPPELLDCYPTDANKHSPGTTNYVNSVSWVLASELHDSTTQLRKLQSRVRNLEQRLTAQEAAADEAIERLCLRCRHLELELKESHQKSTQTLVSQQNLTNYQFDVNSDNYSLGDSDIGNPRYQASSLNASSYKEDNGEELCENIDADLSKSDRLEDLTDTTHLNDTIPPYRCFSYHQNKMEDRNDCHSTVHDVQNHYSTTVELPFFVKQAQDRTRLVNSGGLAGRRPPTRIVVNSPLASLTDASTTSSSQSQVLSVFNPFNSNNNNFFEARSSNFTSNSPRPLPLNSFMFHCSLNKNQSTLHHSKLQIESFTDSQLLPTQTPSSRKPIGYQLPGLTDNSFVTPVLRRSNICTDLSKSSNSGDPDS